MFDLEDDNALRRLCYLAAFLLVFVPLSQALGASWPLAFGLVKWRMATTNNFAQGLVIPFVGLVMMLAIAKSVADAGVSRIIGIVGALCVVGLVVACGLFGLDSLQLRSVVSSRDMPAFNVAVVRVALSLLTSLVAFGVLTYVAFKPSYGQQQASAKGTKRVVSDEPVGFLIGQDMSK